MDITLKTKEQTFYVHHQHAFCIYLHSIYKRQKLAIICKKENIFYDNSIFPPLVQKIWNGCLKYIMESNFFCTDN